MCVKNVSKNKLASTATPIKRFYIIWNEIEKIAIGDYYNSALDEEDQNKKIDQ